MFNGKFKLIGTAIGLVAVLGLAIPGGSQQIEIPTRGRIVQSIEQAFGMLMAAEGILLDIQRTIFLSDPHVTLAFAPLDFAHSPQQRENLIKLLFDGQGVAILGAFYVSDPVEARNLTGWRTLEKGVYLKKLAWHQKEQGFRLIFVDSSGDEVAEQAIDLKLEWSKEQPVKPKDTINTKRLSKEEFSLEIEMWVLPARSQNVSNASAKPFLTDCGFLALTIRTMAQLKY